MRQRPPSAVTAAPVRGAARSVPSWRYLLQQAHLWIGLTLCLPLVFLGLSGSVLVFHHEIDDLFNPALKTQLEPGEPKPIGEILAAAQAAAPRDFVPTGYMAPEHPGDPAVVRLSPPPPPRSQGASGGATETPRRDGSANAGPRAEGRTAGTGQGAAPAPGGAGQPAVQIYLDPATLAVLGSRDPATSAVRKITQLHAQFMARESGGRAAVGWLGVAMLVLGLSGLVLWWPRKGRWLAAFMIKRGARGLRFHRDLHGAAGIWGLVVFIVVSFSGVYLAFPQTVGSAISGIMPARDLRGTAAQIKAQPIEGVTPIGVDAVVALAQAEVPDATLRMVNLPQRPDQPYRINFARPGAGEGAPSTTAFVDPYAQRVIELRDPTTYSAGETVMAWQHALHAGEGLGWAWKILVCLVGLLPLLFVITGTLMWLIKRRARRRAPDLGRVPAE